MSASKPRVVAIIPARLAATRLPDKPLLEIAGRPMIEWVCRRAGQAKSVQEVYVATPDEEIVRVVEGFGGRAIMTSMAHRSGTDRLAEAVAGIQADIVVNVQGDEPLIKPSSIDLAVAPLLETGHADMTSLMCPCPVDQLDLASTVKVVTDRIGYALYFSRARIPHARTATPVARVMQHIGLYAYTRDCLLAFPMLAPSPLEQTEMLEQLRMLENGRRIRMVEVDQAPLSVDTPEDLAVVRSIISAEA